MGDGSAVCGRFRKTVGESSSQNQPEESLVPQEWNCPGIPVSLSHWWASAHGKCGLGPSMVLGFRVQPRTLTQLSIWHVAPHACGIQFSRFLPQPPHSTQPTRLSLLPHGLQGPHSRPLSFPGFLNLPALAPCFQA